MNLQINAGIQNIFNAYQDDFDKGADRDSGYIYGPSLPRSFFVGVNNNGLIILLSSEIVINGDCPDIKQSLSLLRRKRYCFCYTKLTNETTVSEYNKVFSACTIYFVHGRDYFVYSLSCSKRGYNCPLTSF